ncbi:hypothetical protein BJ546DRAFT_1085233 [Cryomyces antarcticus]
MATTLATMGATNANHTAGIYSDMTVDGPEIGTLVVIVDRAKNLPNRKTMGKQDPYCAARLGKEAKKTETDKRGGQTPRWDQELRFTVHDSPDYHSLKVSLFNDDKKTDLIGETWISLEAVVIPGGGQNDLWHTLNCKGKYAGEIRIELTYYDTRLKLEKPVEKRGEVLRINTDDNGSPAMAGPRNSTPVKRRPLPFDPASASASPVMQSDYPRSIPLPQRGPRSYHTPPPEESLPPSHSHSRHTSYPDPQVHSREHRRHLSYQPSSQHGVQDMNGAGQTVDGQCGQYDDMHRIPQSDQRYNNTGYSVQPIEDLPQIPPSSRVRASMPQQLYHSVSQTPLIGPTSRTRNQMILPHSHSAPVVTPHRPNSQDGYAYGRSPPRARRYDQPPGWENPYDSAISIPPVGMQPTVGNDDEPPPPPPPTHRSSASNTNSAKHSPRPSLYSQDASAAPLSFGASRGSRSNTYDGVVPDYQQQQVYAPDVSPLQSVERGYIAHRRSVPNVSNAHSDRRNSGEAMKSSPVYDTAYDMSQSLVPGYSPVATDGTSFRSRQEDRTRTSKSDGAAPSPTQQQSPYDAMPRHEKRASMTRPNSSVPVPVYQNPPDNRMITARLSTPAAASPYQQPSYDTPPRPHPLSQELPRSASPQPYYAPHRIQSVSPLPYTQPAPFIKPRALSPAPPPSCHTPPSIPPSSGSAAARLANRSTPTRKSISPRPSFGDAPPSAERSAVPFSPDYFDAFNPRTSSALSQNGSDLHNSNPNTAPSSHSASPAAAAAPSARPEPIRGFDGRVIDPSDHLPVDSWAPEPEPKGKDKDKGAWSDRTGRPSPLSGPRKVGAGAGAGPRTSRDTVVRLKGHAEPLTIAPSAAPASPVGAAAAARTRLHKKSPSAPAATAPPTSSTSPMSPHQQGPMPLREHANWNFDNAPARGPAAYTGAAYRSPAPPTVPPKVPLVLDDGYEQYGSRGYRNQDHGYGVETAHASPAHFPRGRNAPAPAAAYANGYTTGYAHAPPYADAPAPYSKGLAASHGVGFGSSGGGDGGGGGVGGGGGGGGYATDDFGTAALSRELSRIDIGGSSSSRGRVGARRGAGGGRAGQGGL